MNFNDIDELKKIGFDGFKTMQELFVDSSVIPPLKGIYLILHLDRREPSYLKKGSGGYFKGKDPNVAVGELRIKWIEKTIVIYIGKAGSEKGKSTLNSRLKQYLAFGQGKNVGHWGGRHIWQITFSKDLVVCWRQFPNSDPRTTEKELIRDFKAQYNGLRPFANLSD
jgi:hypothetical protein